MDFNNFSINSSKRQLNIVVSIPVFGKSPESDLENEDRTKLG